MHPIPSDGKFFCTPQVAADWLATRNGTNRNKRAATIARYAGDILAGEWEAGVAVVAFDTGGNLINGQHTLEAIVSTGCGVTVTIVRDLSPRAFEKFDKHVRRTTGDCMRIDSGAAQIVNFAAEFSVGKGSSRYAMAQRGARDAFVDLHGELRDACGTVSRVVTAAPIRTAAIYWRKESGSAAVFDAYRRLATTAQDMRPVELAMLRLIQSGKVRTAGEPARADLYVRAWIVFNPDNASLSSVVATDAKVAHARKQLSRMIGLVDQPA